jgi:LysR family transcriptional regulator, hydrogen peroxide-inducible genes activator
MTLIELNYLTALAQECHFGRAAARLGVSQPALSSALRKLEDNLGYELFERNRKGVRLTSAGAPLVLQAERILAQVEQLQLLAQLDQDQLRAPVALGAPASLGPYLLPQLLMQLSDYWSLASFSLVEATQAELRAKLSNGDLDAALLVHEVSSSVDETKELVSLPLFNEPLALLAIAEHPLAASPTINLAQLVNERLLYVAAEPALITALPEALSFQLQPCSSMESLHQLVLAGQGLGLVPVLAAGVWLSQSPRLVLRPFQPALPERHWSLAWRATYPRHKVIDRLQQALQAATNWQLNVLTQGAQTPLAQDHGHW